MIQKLICLALAGSLGTLARYGLAGFVSRHNSSMFPWGTLTVNLVGCFVAGTFWSLFERWPISGETRTIVMVGFMGAFTTFSSMILETNELLRSAEWMFALANITVQIGLGGLALFVGTLIGRMI